MDGYISCTCPVNLVRKSRRTLLYRRVPNTISNNNVKRKKEKRKKKKKKKKKVQQVRNGQVIRTGRGRRTEEKGEIV